ncbi:lysozyme inhibitor LprI family protein [Comamonas suwonensis]|uniref:DUF1311 domain-containing protein n=1 Tax=Comamonas suwonensis TaxID=2606214 RepID=A0A843BE66_9BURK|nr:lysozyme inhibitor LprI family protein [Comamonas suwonensis]MBI1625917.1 DUF1311 domain-containing protein [Comamonas suwonensis]
MKYLVAIFLTLLLTACGSKIEGTYSNNMTGVAQQKISFTFRQDGTARMAVGSTDIPLDLPYEVRGNKIKVAGQEGDVILTILDNGDLIMDGLRLTKETAQGTAEIATATKPTAQPASALVTNSAPTPVAQEAQDSAPKTWAPSFDCAKASTLTEKAICTDALLGKLDGALAENYKYMLASDIGDGARKNLKATQKEWIIERNKCANNQCLTDIYRKRIDEICEYPVISGLFPVCTASNEIK